MRPARVIRSALVLSALLAAGLVGPAAAHAAPLALPVASLSDIVDVGDLVKRLFEALGDTFVPEAMKDNQWGSEFVRWLVSVPQVTSTNHFPELNDFRRDLSQGVAFGILGLTFAAASLQYLAGGFSGSFTAVDVFKRALLATGALTFYAKIMGLAVVGTNALTSAIVTHENVSDGVNKAIVAVFALTFFTGGAGLGMGLAALMTCLFFLAGIFVMKIGLTAGLAILAVSGPIAWALYPLPSFAWLPKLWGAALVAVLGVPIAWALVFAVAAVTTSDALLLGDGLGQSLEGLVKPFVAVACFYVAFKAPAFMLSCARTLGVNANGLAPASLGGRGGGGGGGATGGGGRVGGARWMAQTNADRLKGLHSTVARPRAQRAAGSLGSRLTAASVSGGMALGFNDTRRAAAFNAAASATSKAARPAAKVAGAMKRENDWWKALPAQGRSEVNHAGSQRNVGAVGKPVVTSAPAGASAATNARSRGQRHSPAATSNRPVARDRADAPRIVGSPPHLVPPTVSTPATGANSGRPTGPTPRPTSGPVVPGPSASAATPATASAARPVAPATATPSGPVTPGFPGVSDPPPRPPARRSAPRPVASPQPPKQSTPAPRSRPEAPVNPDTPNARKRRPRS